MRGALLVLAAFVLIACTTDAGIIAPIDTQTPVPLYLRMSEPDLDELYSRDVLSNVRLPGEFRLSLDAPWEPLRDPSIRFRGSSSRLLPKKSFSVRFADPQPVAFDTTDLNLIAMYTDPSFMRAVIAFGAFRDLDLPASRTGYVDLSLNGVHEGLYVAVERVDEDVAAGPISSRGERAAPEAFTLVRDEFRSSTEVGVSMFNHAWEHEPDPVAVLQQYLDRRGSPDWEAVLELVQWVRATPAGAAYAEGFVDRIDVGAFVDWLAVHILIGDIDSFADDYWLYRDGDDPLARWQFIPWDKDLTFGSHWVPVQGTINDYFQYEFQPTAGWRNALIDKFFETQALHALLAERIGELMDEVLTVGYFEERIAELTPRIAASVDRRPGENAFVRHPQNHFGALGHFEQHAESLLDFVELRYQFLRAHFSPVPAGARRYVASIDTATLGPGDVVYLTDPFGWTMARLALTDVAPGVSSISLRVDQDDRLADVDRLWTFDVEGGTVQGHLTLYYRNLPSGNWYRTAHPPTPIGGQRHLSLATIDVAADGLGDLTLVGSQANPYSNAVSTTAPIALEGRRALVLVDESAER